MRGEEPLKSCWKHLSPHGMGKGSLPEVGSFKEGNPLPALGASAKERVPPEGVYMHFPIRTPGGARALPTAGQASAHPGLRGADPGLGSTRTPGDVRLLRSAEGLSKSAETAASWSRGAAGASAHVVTSQDTHDATQHSADYM